MTAQKKTPAPTTPKTESGKFDTMLEAWRTGHEVGWSDLLAAWVEAPPAPRSSDLVVKVIQTLGAK